MESKICTQCNIEKDINNFYKKYSECEDCNIKPGVKRYYDDKDKISNQQKIYYERNRDKLLQKQNNYNKKRSTEYKELQRSYGELQNRLKALEEKLNTNKYNHSKNLFV